MASQDDITDGLNPGHYDDLNVTETQEPGEHGQNPEDCKDDSDKTESDEEQSYRSIVNDQDVSNESSKSAESQFIPGYPTPLAQSMTNYPASMPTGGKFSRIQGAMTKRLPTTAELSPEKKFQKPFRIPKWRKFETTAAKDAAYVEGLRHYYERKEPRGSHKIGIVCKNRCEKHFLINDWGEPRRHYQKNRHGNFEHHGEPFDHTQFKTMSKQNAEKRARRIREGGETDHASESESDVDEADYKNFNSVPGRPNAIQAKVIKAARPRESKKTPEDAKHPKTLSAKDATVENGTSPQDYMQKCALMQEAFQEAQREIVRLLRVLAAERLERRSDIIALGMEAAAFAAIHSIDNPLSKEKILQMVQNIPAVGDDDATHKYHWTTYILPQVLAGAQKQVDALRESQASFILPLTGPPHFSSSSVLHNDGLVIGQPAPASIGLPAASPRTNPPPTAWNVDASLERYLTIGNPYNGPMTSQQLGLGDGARIMVEALQRASRRQGIELCRENAMHTLDQLAWDNDRVTQIMNDAAEGRWMPPPENEEDESGNEYTGNA